MKFQIPHDKGFLIQSVNLDKKEKNGRLKDI